jgi:hypothetical protein
MRTFGEDRCRAAGDRVILLSAIPKGWTARTPRTATNAEHPGTAVLWDERYYEVVEATGAGGDRVRYVLMPWRDEHTMRTFEAYDAEAEARRHADFALAQKQRRASAAARWMSMLLGHLPSPAQERLEKELGVAPARMTILSCIPPFALFGVLLFLAVGAVLRKAPSGIPLPLFIVAGAMAAESLFRFWVAMATGRGIGSALGTLLYIAYWRASPNRDRLASPFTTTPGKIFTLPPSEDVALRDSLAMKAPWLTLLSRPEQERLAERYGFDYRRHAFAVASIILVCAVLGAVSSYVRVQNGAGAGTLISMFVAIAVGAEQIVRFVQLQRGPASSVFGALVRPFVRDLLG